MNRIKTGLCCWILWCALFLRASYCHRICFHSNDANERGTTAAMIELADYTESMLHHEVVIVLPDPHIVRMGTHTLPSIAKRFPVVFYIPGDGSAVYSPSNTQYVTQMIHNISMITSKISRTTTSIKSKNSDIPSGGKSLPAIAIVNKCDVLFIAKAGAKKSHPSFPESFDCRLPTAVYAQFFCEKHGTTYAVLSKAMAERQKKYFDVTVLPYIVHPPPTMSSDNPLTNLRSELRIPESGLVLCRHGGADTFNIPFVQTAIRSWYSSNSTFNSLYFIFLGTNSFINHPNVHFLGTSIDPKYKERFFASCDAMLHARKDGETFGKAVAEFSVRQKPVITFNTLNSVDREHIHILGDKAFLYHDTPSLEAIVVSFIKNGIPKKDYNAYRFFSPDNVS